MGFSAAIYTYPKYKGNPIDRKTKEYIQGIIDYENESENSWLHSKYKSAEDCAFSRIYDSFGSDSKKQSSEPANGVEVVFIKPEKDLTDFYLKEAHLDILKHKDIDTEQCYWCSNGTEMYDNWFRPEATKKKQNKDYPTQITKDGTEDCYVYYEMTERDVAKFALYCFEALKQYEPKSAFINKAFRYETEEDEDKYSVLSKPEYTVKYFNCDGIEVEIEDEEGVLNKNRLETDKEYGCSIGVSGNNFDECRFRAYLIGLEASLKILSTVDFNTTVVFYEGGY